MKYLVGCLFIFWLSIGLYFGIGGIALMKISAANTEINKLSTSDTSKVVYEGIPFKNMGAVRKYIDEQRIQKFQNVVPFFKSIPDYLALIITGSSFSLLGVLIRILLSIVYKKQSLLTIKYFSEPLLGILTGIVVQGIASLIPIILTGKGIEINAVSLVFFCLFAGIYYDAFYKKVENYFFTKIFTK